MVGLTLKCSFDYLYESFNIMRIMRTLLTKSTSYIIILTTRGYWTQDQYYNTDEHDAGWWDEKQITALDLDLTAQELRPYEPTRLQLRLRELES